MPVDNTFSLLDLLYLEQRLGCWGGPSGYGHVAGRCRLFPLMHRAVFDAMLQLPFEYRAAQRLAHDLINSRWPELLRLPFNTPTGRRGWSERLMSRYRRFVVRHPNVAARLGFPISK